MPRRDWAFRVQDILDAIAKIQRFVSDVDFEAFENDEELQSECRDGSLGDPDGNDARYPKPPIWHRLDGSELADAGTLKDEVEALARQRGRDPGRNRH